MYIELVWRKIDQMIMKEHRSPKKIWGARFPKSWFEEHCSGTFPRSTFSSRKRSSLRRIFSHLEPTLRGFLLRPPPNPTPHPLNWNKIMADSSTPLPQAYAAERCENLVKRRKTVLSRQKTGKIWRLSFHTLLPGSVRYKCLSCPNNLYGVL